MGGGGLRRRKPWSKEGRILSKGEGGRHKVRELSVVDTVSSISLAGNFLAVIKKTTLTLHFLCLTIQIITIFMVQVAKLLF